MVDVKMRNTIVKVRPIEFAHTHIRDPFLPDALKRVLIIRQVFSTKYSLTLPTQALLYIEQVLVDNDVTEPEWVGGLELWAKEYLKEDGKLITHTHTRTDKSATQADDAN